MNGQKVPYVVGKIEVDPERYGLSTYQLNRADGMAGWVTITSPDLVFKMELGKTYYFSVEPAEVPVGLPPKKKIEAAAKKGFDS